MPVLTVSIPQAGSIAHQAAGCGELALIVTSAGLPARAARATICRAAVKERVGANEQRIDARSHGCKGSVDLAVVAGLGQENLKHPIQKLPPHLSNLGLGREIAGVEVAVR